MFRQISSKNSTST